MKHIKTISTKLHTSTIKTGICSMCTSSCQSACKTSCTVANQKCERIKKQK